MSGWLPAATPASESAAPTSVSPVPCYMPVRTELRKAPAQAFLQVELEAVQLGEPFEELAIVATACIEVVDRSA